MAIRKEGIYWVVYSKLGKLLGRYKTRKAAKVRLKTVEYWKHKKKKK